MDEKPPPLKGIILAVSYLILLLVYNVVFAIQTAPEDNQEAEISFGELFYASNIPITPDAEVLGVMLYGMDIDPLLNEIIRCESGFNPDAKNGENGQYGRGLIQLVSKTQKKCEKALGRELDPFNPVDSIECGKYLFEEGTRHWGYEGAEWGSYECWKDY